MFDTFVVGPSNQLAFAASQATASSYAPKYTGVPVRRRRCKLKTLGSTLRTSSELVGGDAAGARRRSSALVGARRRSSEEARPADGTVAA
jgi:hypothetical protein